MAEPQNIQINPYSIIGEKQVRLEILAQHASGLEQRIQELEAENQQLRETIDTLTPATVEEETPEAEQALD